MKTVTLMKIKNKIIKVTFNETVLLNESFKSQFTCLNKSDDETFTNKTTLVL